MPNYKSAQFEFKPAPNWDQVHLQNLGKTLNLQQVGQCMGLCTERNPRAVWLMLGADLGQLGLWGMPLS